MLDERLNIIGRMQRALRLLFIVLLVVVVLTEGYFIFVLSANITNRIDKMKDISIQKQSLKNERDDLYRELSSIKKAGEDRDGDIINR